MHPYTRNDAIIALTGPRSVFSIDQQKVFDVTFPVFTNLPSNLAELYILSESFDDHEFLLFEDDRLTFAEVRYRARNLSYRLVHDFSVCKGDRVVLAMNNCPEWCISYMAVTSIGAVVVMLNAWWQGSELDYGIRDTGAKVAIVDQTCLERLQPYIKRQEIKIVTTYPHSVLPPDITAFSSLLTGDISMPVIDIAPEDDATLFYTSGLTEFPKGVISTHRAVVNSVFARMFGLIVSSLPVLSEEYRHIFLDWAEKGREALHSPLPGWFQISTLAAVPLFHVTGCNNLFLPSFFSGQRLVLMNKWNPERALELIERERINMFVGVPSMNRDLVNSPEFKKRDVSSMLMVFSGGAACPSKQVSELKQSVGALLGTGYGMTETNAVGSFIAAEEYMERPTSVGRAMEPLVSIKTIDAQGKELGPGLEGEICIKSVANMRGYWNQPEQSAQTLQDGWVHTGDLGSIDADGYITITGRAKNIVIRGGENISCPEVENVIYEHPAVMEAVVYGVPNERLGEILVATVVPHAESEVTSRELSTYLSWRLAKFKVPSHIIVQKEPLPRVASGKFDVAELKMRWTSGGRVLTSIIP